MGVASNTRAQTVAEWISDYEGEHKVSSIAKETGGGGDFKKLDAGTHLAACNMVVNLGLHPTEYQGQDTGLKTKVYVRWETPNERVEYEIDGVKKEGPMSIGKTYTLSLNEKASLRKDLEGWRGKSFTEAELAGFDVDTILGTCCQIVVTHREGKDGKAYANVTGVAGWPKGMARIKAENELVSYAEDNTAQYDKLPKWSKEMIERAVQPEEIPDHSDSVGDFDDSIPF